MPKSISIRKTVLACLADCAPIPSGGADNHARQLAVFIRDVSKHLSEPK